jgi:TonB family protein
MTSSMRAILILMSLFLSCSIQAASSYPKPVYTPHAEYPEDMLRNKEAGTATVRIFIHANGSVSFKDMVKASDPQFAEALKQAVTTWRFEAWTPPANKPEGESTLVSYSFDPWLSGRPNLSRNVELRKLRCSQLNNELIWSRRSHPPEETKTFRDTRNYLLNGFVIREFLPETERQVLLDEFDKAKPTVIENCRKSPAALYVDLLPEALRKML